MTIPLADYEEHRQAFIHLLEKHCVANILLFSGASGSGKTTLLTACLRELTPEVTAINIQLRGGAVSVAEIFQRSGSHVGWESLPTFANHVNMLQQGVPVQVDSNRLIGMGNQIHIALHTGNTSDRQQRRASLTQAWFEDLQGLSKPLLLVFDTYEAATPEVQQWIAGPLLARAAYARTVRVLVAGQEVPDVNNIEWGQRCVSHTLLGVKQAEHWLPVIEALERYIPVEDQDPLTWLSGVCYALKGAPKDIMQVIESLPRKEMAA
jgi:GTPase SAR1 family protein